MPPERLRPPLFLAVQVLMAAAVTLMAGWNAYIALRLRPDLATVGINLAFWLGPILILLAVTGQWWRSLALGTTITFGLQRLHWLKWRYLEQTWTLADLRFAADATWFVLSTYPETVAYAIAGATMLALSWWLPPRRTPAGLKARAAAAFLTVTLAGGIVAWHDRHPFDPFGFNAHGHFANLVYSWSTLDYEPPATAGSSALFRERAAALAEVAPPTAIPTGGAPTKPDIVIWLQESTMDLRLFDLPGVPLPSLAMYQPDPRTRAHGRLRVHSWGGGTWLTEFALLTGLSHRDFGATGNAVYYTATPHVRYTLPRLLKQHGYRTVALTGAPKRLYNSKRAHRDLGFDDVLDPLDFPEWGGKSLTANPIDDVELGRYARRILSRSDDRPVLLFVLSIEQHGPYDPRYPVRHRLDRARLRPAEAARVSDYVDRMVATDRAAMTFAAEWLAEAPAVFAYFGDHQPNLGVPLPYVEGLASPRFLTSYAIKSSRSSPAPLHYPAPLDVAYLGALILEQAGIALDPLFEANRAMRVLCDGQLTDCPDRALADSYRAYLYRDLGAALPR